MGRKSKDPITCYHKWRCRCPIHDMKCNIPVEFHPADTRGAFVNLMAQRGAGQHTKDSEHRCEICDIERQQGRRKGYYQRDPVDGKFKPVILLERLQKERAERKSNIEKSKSSR